MDIAALSIMMSQSQLAQNVSIAVADLAMEQQQANMKQMTELLTQATPAPHPTLGKTIDISI